MRCPKVGDVIEGRSMGQVVWYWTVEGVEYPGDSRDPLIHCMACPIDGSSPFLSWYFLPAFIGEYRILNDEEEAKWRLTGHL